MLMAAPVVLEFVSKTLLLAVWLLQYQYSCSDAYIPLPVVMVWYGSCAGIGHGGTSGNVPMPKNYQGR